MTMLGKRAIKVVPLLEDEMVSAYLASHKKNGKWPPIVCLKYINTQITCKRLNMVTAVDVMCWIRPGYYMASVDLS